MNCIDFFSLRQLCALRELFHGRFDDAESAILLEINENDVRQAANMVLVSDPSSLSKILQEEKAKWVGKVRQYVEFLSDCSSLLSKIVKM